MRKIFTPFQSWAIRSSLATSQFLRFFKPVSAGLFLTSLLFQVQFMQAQAPGYLYIHTKSVSQDINQSFNFSVTSTGGTPVSPFTLEDQALNIEPTDIGAGHGTGGGELWAIAGGTLNGSGSIYHRGANSTTWNMIPTGAGSAIDGADYGHFVVANTTGDVYVYNGSSYTMIFNHSTYGVTAMDVANSGSITSGAGLTAIVDNSGQVWKYTGNYTSTFTWTKYTPTDNSGYTFTRLDINPTTNDILLTDASGAVTKINASGTVLAYYARPASVAANNDIAVDGYGNFYVVAQYSGAGDILYRYNGSAWSAETQLYYHYRLTCGDAQQVWAINGNTSSQESSFLTPSTIFTRVGDGSGNWLDDERIQTTQNDNSIIIPVSPGTYNITQANVSNWNLQGITIYDSTVGSASSVATKTASIVVTSGRVAHVVFTNGLVAPLTVPSTCGTSITIQNFGSGPTGTRGNALTGLTDFHYYNNASSNTTPDGYYSLTQNSQGGWTNPNVTDHTGLTGGYFLMVNASIAPNEFYRQRITNLVPGATYTMSFWAVNLSPAFPLLPNVLAGITDTATGTTLGSVSTGNVPTDNNWHQYTFSFVATLTTGDLFLRNNAPGGLGNDLGIDDISFSQLCSTLPVTLLDFTAQKQNSNSLLNWTTTNEINFDHFEVERSADEVNWVNIGSVAGKGTGSLKEQYLFTDASTLEGNNYYRLRMVDLNGAQTLSEIKTLQFGNGDLNIVLYPNPVRSGNIVTLKSSESLQTINVFDLNGKMVLVNNCSTSAFGGNTVYSINTSRLPQGIYVVQAFTVTGDVSSFKLVKQGE